MIPQIARSAANLMCKAFTGHTLDEYELQQWQSHNLTEVNRCIEQRLDQLGYVFRDQSEMRRRIETAFSTTADMELREVIVNDEHLMTLLELNAQIGNQ